MTRHTRPGSPRDPQPVSAARGMLFMLGMLGFFHGLVAVVDPML